MYKQFLKDGFLVTLTVEPVLIPPSPPRKFRRLKNTGTQAGMIRSYILANEHRTHPVPDETILEETAKAFGKDRMKADAVRYYRHQLIHRGELKPVYE